MPVDRMIGLRLRAMCASSGKLVISPEDILNAATPRSSKRSALASSKGVDKNKMPRAWACSHKAWWSSCGKLQAAQHGVLRFAGAGLLGLVGCLGRGGRHEQIGAECLEFDGIGAGIGGDVDELPRQGRHRRCD